MSIDQLPPRRAPRPSDDAKLVQYDEYIDTHIRNTRRAVKAVDWATALVLLGTGVVVFLLTAAVVEHWILPGGFPNGVRIALFALLVGGVGYFAYLRLWTLCRRAINPVYAAQTIEQSSPTLKNSLINLLLFRQHRSDISDAVYQTLEEQAAQRLTRVPVDAAVDRSHLIRFGYVLVAVVAVAALYKVLSPKDPWVTAERILMPWSDIVPASRVAIRDVEPGSLTVARGEFINVSAEVRGLDENETVVLRYTTDDGQALDKPVTMRLSKDGMRFEGRLPDDDTSASKSGVAQNLHYRIEAGDARTLDYHVKVVPAPSILVKRVEYDYPEYTGYLDREVDDLGDIKAIEGTRITILARANGPIQKAHVDFDADGRPDLPMTASGDGARASFELALREDRQTPQHASYVLRFTNTDGRPNHSPVKHPIAVDRDLSPEAAILLPKEKAIDVRLNDTVAIEIEASDPDFALAEVRLRGEVPGRVVIDEPLLKGRHKGRFTGRYQFTPSAHDLRAGDVLKYWVIANDNRAPQPNTAETEQRLIRIISADPAQQPPPDRIAQRDHRQPNDQQQGEQRPQDEGQQGDGEQGGQSDNQQGEQQPGAQGNQQFSRDAQRSADQPPQNGEPPQDEKQPQDAPQNQQQDGQSGDSQPGANPAQDGNESQSKRGEGQPGNQQQPDQTAKENSQPQNQPEGASGASQQSDPPQQDDEQNESGTKGQNGQQRNPNAGNSDGKQTGAGAAGGESPNKGSQPDGTRPDQVAAPNPQNGRGKQGGQPADNRAEPAPVSSEGDNDAEAFERIQKHLERNGELKEGESSSSAEPRQADDQKQGDNQRQGDKETGRQGDTEKSPADGAADDAAGDKKPESPDGTAHGQKTDAHSSQQPGNQAKDQGEGTGAETRQDDLPGNEQKPDDAGEQVKSPGGQQTSSKGPSGAGQEQENQGAANSAPNLKPTEKRQQSGSDGKQLDKEEPSAGAGGKSESDSQGDEGGDKAGGSEEGGGQKAPREGTGSAGQNQSADEGAGESAEKGEGNISPNAGEDSKADRPTGQSDGETSGRGSKQRDGQGEQPGGKPGADDEDAAAKQKPFSHEAQPSADQGQGDKENGRQGENESAAAKKEGERQPGQQDGSQTGDRSNQQSGERGGTPTGDGGLHGTESASPSTAQGEVPDGDAANLDYARKQTDLVLDKLADQLKRKRVDKNLLDQLGWTEEDLQKFVERWQNRKEAAQRNDPAGETARRELNDALRSLGLRRDTLRQGPIRDDTLRDFREGYRGPVPAKYQDRLRAYNQGVSRAQQDGE